jgi:hypothetical protein
VLFMMTSLGLSIVSSHRQDRGTVLDEIPAGAPTTAPVTPGGGTPTDPTAGESVPQTPDSPVDTSGGTEPQ